MGIEQADLSLLAAILAFFDSPSLREEYENRVNAEGGGGRALLRILRVEHDNVPLGVCNATIAKIDLAFQQGIPDFTRPHVSAFHLRVDKLNSQLPAGLRITEASLAAKYAAMFVHFDPEVNQKIELADVVAGVAMRGTLVGLRAVLNVVLSKLELEESSRRAYAALTGAAYAASAGGKGKGKGKGKGDGRDRKPWGDGHSKPALKGDPHKGEAGKPSNSRPWQTSDGPCRHCLAGGPSSKTAGHWNKDCPDKPPGAPARKPDAKAAVAVEPGAAHVATTFAASDAALLVEDTGDDDVLAMFESSGVSANVALVTPAASPYAYAAQPNSDIDDESDDDDDGDQSDSTDDDDETSDSNSDAAAEGTVWVHSLRWGVGLNSLTTSNRPDTGHMGLIGYLNRTYGGPNETFDFSSV